MSDLFSLAVIPARGGSKRIPRKNIKMFLGKPIIAYSLAAAQKAKCFSDIIVSTDDKKISSVVKKLGGKVPFLRSRKTADDNAGLADVLQEVIIAYEEWAHRRIDLVCCILATAPLVMPENIFQGYQLVQNDNFDAVLPVVRYSYPIQRAVRVDKKYVSMIWPKNYMKRSQELEPTYHDVGQFYWIKRDRLFEYGKIFIPRLGYIIIDEAKAQDIDTERDWYIAEKKYESLQSKKIEG
jgi:N-acylneuraminate cytidylyltransferase